MSGTEYHPLLSVLENTTFLTPWSGADHPVGRGEGFTGRTAIGYDHGYDAEVFYLRLALDEKYVEGSLDRPARTIREEGTPRLT
jgi:hypothetical protein